ncbi:MAG: DUF1853 family protein, partial [Myxococcota bacterium]
MRHPDDETLARQPRYEHRRVADLAWAIGSPAMCVQPIEERATWVQTEGCMEELDQHRDWLSALDAEPSALHAFLDARPTRRLGHYFEHLHSFWFQHSPVRRHIAEGVVLYDGKQTLGELDFVYARDGRPIHLEIAVKFYLRAADAPQTDSYVGPGLRDRFDRKLEKLKLHQSRRLELPAASDALEAVGVSPDEMRTEVRLKGVLFEPLGSSAARPPEISETCLRGEWLTLGDMHELSGRADEWHLLDRLEWLSGPGPARPSLSFASLCELLSIKVQRGPMHLCSSRDGKLDARYFVVAEDF